MKGARATSWWAGFFGVSPEVFLGDETHFVPHAALGGWDGVWVFRRGEATVVSTPPACLARVTELLGDVPDERILDRALLGERLARPDPAVIGPAWWGRLDADGYRPVRDGRVRVLGDADAAAIARFRDACGAEWDTSSIDPAGMRLYGAFEGDEISAIAGWRARDRDAGDPCLLTTPARRGAGLGAAVASAACGEALAREELVLYQTLASNTRALALARRLGFVQDAAHVAVRMEGAP